MADGPKSMIATAMHALEFLGPLISASSPTHHIAAGSEATGLPFHVFVKDESQRLGQKSFKAMGGSYAGAKAIARARGLTPKTFADVQNGDFEKVTLASASDGNHGAGLAWAARELGQPAVIWLPQGASPSRVDMAAGLGADVRVTDVCYDDTVALARKTATEEGWLLVQDTAWEGYTQVPRDIMDVYSVIAHEAVNQMKAQGHGPATHVILQCGVGSFAAAILEYMREALGPAVTFIGVEPTGSACLMASLRAGTKTEVGDCPETISVGLDCGIMSDLAWPVLRDELAASATVSDAVSCDGLLAAYRAGITAGESGCGVGIGLLRAMSAEERKAAFGIDEHSRVLIFNTEGMTAPEITARIKKQPTCHRLGALADQVHLWVRPAAKL